MITFAKFSVSVFASTLATILPPVEANLIEAPTFPPKHLYPIILMYVRLYHLEHNQIHLMASYSMPSLLY